MGLLERLLGRADLAAAAEAIRASRGRGDRSEVARLEMAIQRDPSRVTFDPDGTARIRVLERTYHAGRFEAPTLATLRARCPRPEQPQPVRLSVVLGTGPLTDIGALQANAAPGALFQVASQFNCLEAPGPYLVPVADYFHDPTQGPRASISAFPATLIRHYAAPAPDGTRFEQTTARQVDLLADVVPGVVRDGYLMNVADPAGLLRALEERFELVRVGVHDEAQVMLGYDFDGAVEGERRVAQLFTSTYALGYSARGALGELQEPVCRQLLRAAYLGTLLAAVWLGKRLVVLTAIGGGVFRNPHALIWEAIVWAVDQVAPLAAAPLDVVLNGRDFGAAREEDVAARGGEVHVLGHQPRPDRKG